MSFMVDWCAACFFCCPNIGCKQHVRRPEIYIVWLHLKGLVWELSDAKDDKWYWYSAIQYNRHTINQYIYHYPQTPRVAQT